MLTYNWVRNSPQPEIASKTLHSCQNWDRLVEWRQTHDVTKKITHLERPLWVTRPDVEYPGPPGAAEPQVTWETEKAYLASLGELSTRGDQQQSAGFMLPSTLEIRDAKD